MPVNYGHHRSDRIFEVMKPSAGIRDDLVRRGLTPRDHTRDNKMHIKSMQKLASERKSAADAVAAKAAQSKTAAKTAGVASRVAAQLARPASAPAVRRPASARAPPTAFACPQGGHAHPGRIHTAWVPPPLLAQGALPAPDRRKWKPPVPVQSPRGGKGPAVDFVRRNAELSGLTPRKAAAVVPAARPATAEKSRHHGRLPPYLLDRKMAAAALAAAAAEAAAPRACPVGTHVLPEAERVEVLAEVREGQAKLNADGMGQNLILNGMDTPTTAELFVATGAAGAMFDHWTILQYVQRQPHPTF